MLGQLRCLGEYILICCSCLESLLAQADWSCCIGDSHSCLNVRLGSVGTYCCRARLLINWVAVSRGIHLVPISWFCQCWLNFGVGANRWVGVAMPTERSLRTCREAKRASSQSLVNLCSPGLCLFAEIGWGSLLLACPISGGWVLLSGCDSHLVSSTIVHGS